ncbi:Wadjet anti-phage system protein JetD domain-containing protein [Streptomyces sp. NPDC048297]|uniref:Wadjet anti-phage system protein JetD domain-containing protein n=1 Tax=Streptomyces sp. NPDC048297 TaxID=3365531 RepID=UPI00371F5B52
MREIRVAGRGLTNRQSSGNGCFAILNRLRRTCAHAQSILMNRPTLLEHRGRGEGRCAHLPAAPHTHAG